jgi:hypothetical protein
MSLSKKYRARAARGFSLETIMKKLITATLLSLLAGLALSHSGGTDSVGCHHDRKTGIYHCH